MDSAVSLVTIQPTTTIVSRTVPCNPVFSDMAFARVWMFPSVVPFGCWGVVLADPVSAIDSKAISSCSEHSALMDLGALA